MYASESTCDYFMDSVNGYSHYLLRDELCGGYISGWCGYLCYGVGIHAAMSVTCTAVGLWAGRFCTKTFCMPGYTCVHESLFIFLEKCNTEKLCSKKMWSCRYLRQNLLGLLDEG